MGTYRFYIAWTSFPLMGIGVLGNLSDQSPLPLSFPVKGKEGIRALPLVGLFIGRPIGAASNPIFEGAYQEHKGRRIF